MSEQNKQEPYGYFKYDMRLDAWVKSQTNRGVPFYTTPPAAQRLEAVNAQLLDALGWIAVVNAMDYEYQNKARAAIAAAKGEA